MNWYRTLKFAYTKLTSEQENEIAELYQSHNTRLREIADAYNIDISVIHRIVREKNIPLRPERKLSPSQLKNLTELHQAGYTVTQLGRLYDISVTRVSKLLRDQGALNRGETAPFSPTTDELQDILRRKDSGEPLRSIARSFNISHGTLGRYLRNKGYLPPTGIPSQRNSKPARQEKDIRPGHAWDENVRSVNQSLRYQAPGSGDKISDAMKKIWEQRGPWAEWVAGFHPSRWEPMAWALAAKLLGNETRQEQTSFFLGVMEKIKEAAGRKQNISQTVPQ